jgi:DNA segregation ATPase FtsK/SpoIIIE, S-DNA-T family
LAQGSAVSDERLERELVGVGLVVGGLLILAGLLLSAYQLGGALPQAVSSALRFLVGSGAYVVAVGLVGLGVVLLHAHGRALNGRVLTGLVLAFLCFLLARHMGVPRDNEFVAGALYAGGGIVGAGLWWAAARAFGPICTWIVIAGVLLVASVLLTQGAARAASVGIVKGAAAGGRWAWGRVRRPRTARAEAAPAPQPPEPPAPVVPQVIDLTLEPEASAEAEAAPAAESAAEVGEGAPAVPLPTSPEPEPAPIDVPEPVAHRKPAGLPSTASQKPRKRSQRGAQLPLLDDEDLYQPPPLSLIEKLSSDEGETREQRHQAEGNIRLLEDTLASFGIQAKVRHYVRGPAVTRYEVEPVRGIRVSRIARLADDLALAFAAIDVRVEAPIPGKSLIGIEVPNSAVGVVGLRGILDSEAYRKHKSLLAVCIGRDIAGAPVIADLSRMPHLLIAGATNSGKTVCLHSIITSLLMRARPDEVKLILIDPKRVELMLYDGIPHLMAPVVQTAQQAADVLRKMMREMERRYDMFAMKGVVNVNEYNQLAQMEKEDESEDFEPLPFVVLIIDELADLMMQAKAEFEFSICRLAQLARATGIHLVIATQRPSVNVITGTIKANIASRIALTVASIHDSRTIIDGQGAERLIGCGDMLYAPFDANKPRRVQGAYVPRKDLEKLVEYLRDQGEPDYQIIPEVREEEGRYADDAEPSDELYQAAVDLVAAQQEASVSMLQRRFKIGYARAGRLIDMMEERGVVGPSEGSKARKVLVPPGYRGHLSGHSLYDDAEEEEEEDAVMVGGTEEEA